MKNIFRIEKRTTPFVQIDRRIFEDELLSWKAKGILGYLLSRPDDWRVIMDDLLKRSPDSACAVRTALQQLKRRGYARLEQLRDDNGKMAGTRWVIREEPGIVAIEGTQGELLHRDCGFPSLGKSACGKTACGKSSPTNKDLTNKEDTRGAKERDAFFDALAESCGCDPKKMTRRALAACGMALDEIRKASPDLALDEFGRRAARYRQVFPQAALTPNALCAQWEKCRVKGEQTRRDIYTEPEGWRSAAIERFAGTDLAEQIREGLEWLEISATVRQGLLERKTA